MPPEWLKKWVREESNRGVERLAYELERHEFARTRRRARIGWGAVDYYAHALLGIVEWPTDPQDVARLECMTRVLMQDAPTHVREFLRATLRAHALDATPPAPSAHQDDDATHKESSPA